MNPWRDKRVGHRVWRVLVDVASVVVILLALAFAVLWFRSGGGFQPWAVPIEIR